MIQHHPTNDMLLEHAAGTLPWAFSLGVAAHLQMCLQCRQHVHYLNELGGALLESTEPSAPSPSAFNRLMSKIDQAAEGDEDGLQDEGGLANSASNRSLSPAADALPTELPRVIRKFLPPVLNWEKVPPSLRVARLYGNETEAEVSLYRIANGGRINTHNHSGLEITLVLSGNFSDARGLYSAGDFLVQEPGEVHRPTATENQPCYCLTISQAPMVPTGLFGWLAQRLQSAKPSAT